MSFVAPAPPSRARMRHQARITAIMASVLMLSVLMLSTGCSETTSADGANADGIGGTDADAATGPTTTIARTRADGPGADLSQELTGGNGVFMGSMATKGQAEAGYIETELVAAGDAVRYDAGPEWTEDGRWDFTQLDEAPAPYRTRALVRRPSDSADFSGTVVIEWLNVSAGLDADPEWSNLQEELIREGHAWVGLSTQLIGVEGGPVLVSVPGAEGIVGQGLVNTDAVRYGSLEHPGDGYSFDIFTQVARAVREGDGLGGLEPQQVLAAGESQSAMALVTYHNGVQPLTGAFDGFFVHSRASMALPVVGPDEYADLASAFGSTPAKLRDDLDVPVMVLQSEGDVTGLLNSSATRQPDGENFRLWEVAGTAHADQRLVGDITALIDCGAPINDGPMHVAAKAAFHHFEAWARGQDPPPGAALIELVDDSPTPAIRRDDDGIALGGLRLAPVDVPIEALSGEPGPSGELICQLFGSTNPLPAEQLSRRFPTVTDYTTAYEAAIDGDVDDGHVLEADRAAMGEYMRTDRLDD